MFAIVEIAGQQFRAEAGKKLYVHHLSGKEGDAVEFKSVLLTDQNGSVRVGTPYISGLSMKATILSHPKGDKVVVFKKKRRKGYKLNKGHRQQFTQIQVESIG